MSQDRDQQERRTVVEFCRQVPRRYPVFSVALGIIILVLIIWFLPYWQVPAAGLSLKDRLHQINENRKTVAQIVGGVFLLVGLYIAWVRSEAATKMAEVNREQQLTDLYVKAIEQLGSENLQIRLGGIYALERIARESPKDHWPIMEVLTAFVRENAPLKDETETYAAFDGPTSTSTPEKPPTDIQAVLTVLGRTAIAYAQEGETRSLDLRATHLAGANLMNANLKEAYLSYANLQDANLSYANLQGADLCLANLQGAKLYEANLQGADLEQADLQEVYLGRANLKGAGLLATNLQGANLWAANLQKARLPLAMLRGASLNQSFLQEVQFGEANLQGASLKWANFQGAKLSRANLQGANLENAEGLDTVQVAEAIWDETTKWPDGFSPPQPRKEEKVEGE